MCKSNSNFFAALRIWQLLSCMRLSPLLHPNTKENTPNVRRQKKFPRRDFESSLAYFFFFKTKFLLILLHFSLGLSISSGSALSFILLLLYFVSSYSLPLTRLSRASILSHSFAQNLMYKLYFTLLLQYRPTEE